MYKADGTPKALPLDILGHAVAASASNHNANVPDQVYVAVSRTNLQFQFGNSGSAFVNFGTVPIGTTLNIRPTAWNNSAAAAGDVIYIYRGSH